MNLARQDLREKTDHRREMASETGTDRKHLLRLRPDRKKVPILAQASSEVPNHLVRATIWRRAVSAGHESAMNMARQDLRETAGHRREMASEAGTDRAHLRPDRKTVPIHARASLEVPDHLVCARTTTSIIVAKINHHHAQVGVPGRVFAKGVNQL
ncbi:uncharacterized protein MYCFIDRAFT_211160 [Pseudocercospora fijiensis CIRAD86]|uniref:Uncharacterized protein n=1 Tax=Pseudocercospora fijiensis (strain CIRAD86) TaxID=383855 RepID=M2YYU2_PSEFD|nr:uncharacterized protein MYCFIDRAFT_211160 [Pseudocercospora fijiensis CIRAD86]EME82800.1 hypothetical protein MYCFIDRAFT_211160 [Pseudocercospora fijiensis CIRAD86]